MQGIDDYEILETLHESANSLVLRARDGRGTALILKVLKKDYPSPVELTRYRQEYEITRSLRGEHVIAAHDLRKHQNTLIMALEDFGGESLSRLLARRRPTMREVLDVATQLVTALGEVHAQHVVHKDVNPSNVVWNADARRLKLIDFGIATRLSRENPVLRSPEVLEGTLAYMSPEQTGRTSRSMDYRTDYYSLGATLYQLATGSLPFPTEDPVELVHSHIAREVVPAHEVDAAVPVVLSKLIGKLMAKAAEDRYQSAHGLLHDLQVCERAVAGEPTPGFEPGRHDASDRFAVPQKLYGREHEVTAVLETFRRVSDGRSELLLIAGYSGVGKTALIQEVYEPITARRGYFAAGKFDQLQRNVPFSALVRALRDLVRQLLSESEERLTAWRHRLMEALGPNGQVIVDVIPEVELVVGPQEPVPELASAEAMNRFNLVFSSFIRVFCGGGRPLVLFLDDLQWADSATLELLQLMLTDEATENLLLIGAYRDNEVDALHPLTAAVERLRERGATIGRLQLSPLELPDLRQLVADTLHREVPEIERLAELVMAKTRGNPFFVMQFLEMLHREGLVVRAAGRWEWDVARIEAAGITDNVVDLLVDKLRRLPEATQEALRVAACVGNRFDLETLALVHRQDPAETYAALLPALEEGLVLPVSGLETLDPAEPLSPLLIRHYRFQHDRVQQSAYALLRSDEEKQAIHLEIGRRLLATMSPRRLAERVFDVVDHLDRARALITEPDERRRLCELNLEAGKKAKEATAYAAARQYLQVAHEALPADAWETCYPLALELHMLLAEVEYLVGDFQASETLADLVLARAHTDLERARVHAMLIEQYTLRTMFGQAIATGQTQLRLLGIELPLDDLQARAPAMLGGVAQMLGERPIASLYELPDVEDPRLRMAHVALRHLTIAAFLANQALFPVVTALSVHLSLEHGNAPESALSYSNYGLILGAFMGRYREGAEFGELGLRLCGKFHPHAPTATACLVVGSELVPWVEHVSRSIPVLERGWQVGLEQGDILWGGYLAMYKLSHECFMGKNIEALLTAMPETLAFVQRTKNQGALNGMLAHRLVLSNLAGETTSESDYAAGELREAEFRALCETHQSQMALCFLHILQAQAQYLHRQPAAALASTRAVDDKLAFIVDHVQLAEHRLYQALALVALAPELATSEREAALEQVRGNLAQLAVWASFCPANFAHKQLLVAAELARLEGDPAAIDLYDQAIEAARKSEFVQDQALASELAARHWLGRNRKGRIGQMYLRDARYAYDLWGARRKVEALETEFADVLGGSSLASSLGSATVTISQASSTTTTTTRMSGSDRLDLASVLKASQAISGEIALADLLRRMIRIVIENAGAQRGVMLLEQGGAWSIAAEGSVDEDEVSVLQGRPLVGSDVLSVAVVQYVINSKATVVLHDATRQGRFTADPYVVARRPKSVLCMPILHQGRVSGVLYLENNLGEGTFTADRLGVLRVLASQAAISIENATLYASLEAYNQTLEQKVEERTRDILRTQDQLVAQEKLAWMGALSVGIAHEIKNPLNFINNFAEVSTELAGELVEELRSKEGRVLGPQDFDALDDLLVDLTGNMEKIRHYGKRADGIVESMKVLAEGGGKDPADVDVNQQVEELSNVVHHGRVAQGASFEVRVRRQYDPAIGVRTVVPQGLGRVLVNLLNNAYDALEERRAAEPGHEGELSIRTADGDRWFEIVIRDNGRGIAQKHLPHIKSPFYTTRPAGSGHIGLGLSVSEDIVTLQHHGELLVRTEEGAFAEFVVRLPKDLGRTA